MTIRDAVANCGLKQLSVRNQMVWTSSVTGLSLGNQSTATARNTSPCPSPDISDCILLNQHVMHLDSMYGRPNGKQVHCDNKFCQMLLDHLGTWHIFIVTFSFVLIVAAIIVVCARHAKKSDEVDVTGRFLPTGSWRGQQQMGKNIQ